MPRPPSPAPAPLEEALARVGDRWTLAVVAALLEAPARFSDLGEAIPGIAPNVLAQRLRRMEADGIVVARPYSDRPPRAAYELTAAGRELGDAVLALAAWGARHVPEAARPLHAVCGTPLALRWWCPTCEEPADPREGDGDHHV